MCGFILTGCVPLQPSEDGGVTESSITEFCHAVRNMEIEVSAPTFTRKPLVVDKENGLWEFVIVSS